MKYGSFLAWLPVVCLALSAFIFNTTELVPVGLLTSIAKSFEMDPAHTGSIVTIYAWAVAVLSLPLTVLTAKYDRRKLLICLFAIFTASHLLAGFAWNFTALLIARIGIACAHAVFWAITVPLAVRVAPHGKRNKAIALVVAGSSLAAVMGVPLGTIIGQSVGWRVTFLCIGVTAAMVLFALHKLLPPLPSKNAGNFSSLPVLIKRPALVWIYVLIAVVITGEFTAYTYIGPFMEDIGFEESVVVWLLLLLGGAGLFGTYLYGVLADRYPDQILVAALALLFLSLLALRFASFSLVLTGIVCVVWGTVLSIMFLGLQSRMLDAATDATDVATSIYSGIFNVGIGGGAFVGSFVCLYMGSGSVGFVGSGIVFAALILCVIYLKHTGGHTASPQP
ncbi:sugar efflux transporter [Campylobacterota bacterium]|nr:sugar efflux transporter [Campylobacterota bacterium]